MDAKQLEVLPDHMVWLNSIFLTVDEANFTPGFAFINSLATPCHHYFRDTRYMQN